MTPEELKKANEDYEKRKRESLNKIFEYCFTSSRTPAFALRYWLITRSMELIVWSKSLHD